MDPKEAKAKLLKISEEQNWSAAIGLEKDANLKTEIVMFVNHSLEADDIGQFLYLNHQEIAEMVKIKVTGKTITEAAQNNE